MCHIPMHVCWGLGVVSRLYGYQLKAQDFKHLQSSKKQHCFKASHSLKVFSTAWAWRIGVFVPTMTTDGHNRLLYPLCIHAG